MGLILYEFKKSFLKKSLLIILLLFSVLNVWKIYDTYMKEARFSHETMKTAAKGYWEVYYTHSKGEITQEKIQYAMDSYRTYKAKVDAGNYSTEYNPELLTGYVYGDYGTFEFDIIPQMEYAYLYSNTSIQIAQKAAANIDFYAKHDNPYEVKNQQQILKLYQGRSISDYYTIEGQTFYISYDFSALLVLLMLLVGLTPVFVGERESGMQNILRTSVNGGIPTASAKIIASLFYILLLWVWFNALDFLAFSHFLRMEGWSNPIYALKIFVDTPLTMRIGQYLLLDRVLVLLGYIVAGSLFLVMSFLFSRVITPFLVNFVALLGFIYANDFVTGLAGEILSHINPATLITNWQLFSSYSVAKIMNTPVLSYVLTISSLGMLAAILVGFILFSSRKRRGGVEYSAV